MRALTYSLCISSAAGFSAVASWYDAGTRLTNADIAEATGVVTPTDGVYPMLGGANKQYKVKSVAREAWTPPADWKAPTKSVGSWYDRGERLVGPSGPTAVTGMGWGLHSEFSDAPAAFPMLGGTNKQYKVKSVAREAWTPPPGWEKPTKSVSSWYDRGERLVGPSGPTAVTGSGWGLGRSAASGASSALDDLWGESVEESWGVPPDGFEWGELY